MQETIPFRVHPRAIKEIGERLVTDDFVALAELVKNSYDAMASKVTIRFGEESTGPFIEIEDNGEGMSLEIIRNVWTVLFTPYKKILAAKTRKGGRKLSGEKGIGRLSAARLGRELEIFTQERNQKCYHILLQWDDFDDLDNPKSYSDFEMSEFGVVVETAQQSPFLLNKSGTLIHISNLRRQDWLSSKERFEEVARELSRIRPPLRKYEDFEIFLNHSVFAPESQSLSVEQSQFLNNPHYLFVGAVDSNGCLNAKLSIRKPGVDTTKSFDEKKLGGRSSEVGTKCGPFKFEFRVWDLDSESAKDMGSSFHLTVREIREAIRKNKGVSLYRDEILVLPKTSGTDWLNLEQRRVSKVGDKISSANIIGFVDITLRDNPEIRDKADREALEKNQASEHMIACLIEIVELLETERKVYKSKKSGKYVFHDLFENEKIEMAFSLVRDSLAKGDSPEKILKTVGSLENTLNQQRETVTDRLGYYSRLASVGTIASYMVHEVRNSSTSISACNRDGRALLQQCESKGKENVLKRLDISDRALGALESLTSAILPLSGAKFKRKTGEIVSLKGILDSCAEANQRVIEHAGVQFTYTSSDVDLAISEGELFILMQNLLQNALYWIGREKKTGGKIQVRVEQNVDRFAVIYFDDNGPGIDPEHLEAIFMPGISSKPDGTGMGLTVVAEICEKYKGSVAADSSKILGGASFKVVLPRE